MTQTKPDSIWIDSVQALPETNRREEIKDAPHVAMLAGRAMVIEMIVRMAEKETGFVMDWGFIGGRAIVRSHGDRAEIRKALYSFMPQSDLGVQDLVG